MRGEDKRLDPASRSYSYAPFSRSTARDGPKPCFTQRGEVKTEDNGPTVGVQRTVGDAGMTRPAEIPRSCQQPRSTRGSWVAVTIAHLAISGPHHADRGRPPYIPVGLRASREVWPRLVISAQCALPDCQDLPLRGLAGFRRIRLIEGIRGFECCFGFMDRRSRCLRRVEAA